MRGEIVRSHLKTRINVAVRLAFDRQIVQATQCEADSIQLRGTGRYVDHDGTTPHRQAEEQPRRCIFYHRALVDR